MTCTSNVIFKLKSFGIIFYCFIKSYIICLLSTEVVTLSSDDNYNLINVCIFCLHLSFINNIDIVCCLID